MKKSILIILSIIVLGLTFFTAEILSIYDFGTIPTLLTTLYLIAIFSILEYLFIFCYYIISKIRKKEKINKSNIIGLILLFGALILILLFIIAVNIDWLNKYIYSTPFYYMVIGSCIEFLLPAVVLLIFGIKLIRKK